MLAPTESDKSCQMGDDYWCTDSPEVATRLAFLVPAAEDVIKAQAMSVLCA